MTRTRPIAPMTRLPRLLLLAAALLAGGCATQKQVADQMVKANLVVEDAFNRQLLLNIVRASQHRPLVFTAVNRLGPPIGGGTGELSLSIPLLGPKEGGSLTGGFRSDPPSFDVSVLDTQEFTRGILTQVTLDTLNYYIENGWPTTLVLSLLVDRIDIISPTGTEIASYRNAPHNRADFDNFQRVIERLNDCGFTIEKEQNTEAVGPLLSVQQASDMDKLMSLAKQQNLQLRRVVTQDAEGEKQVRFGLYKRSSQTAMKLKRLTDGVCTLPNAAIQLSSDYRLALRNGDIDDHVEPAGNRASEMRLRLRSPAALFSYLGEVLREEGMPGSDNRFRVRTSRFSPPEPILVVRRSPKPFPAEPGELAVEYNGTTYTIPAYGTGRTWQSLQLLNQLVGLKKDVSELPGTGTVRIIQQKPAIGSHAQD